MHTLHSVNSIHRVCRGGSGEGKGHPPTMLGKWNELHYMVINGLMEVQRLSGRSRFSEYKMRVLSCAEMWCKSLCRCQDGSFTFGQILKEPTQFVLQIIMVFTVAQPKLNVYKYTDRHYSRILFRYCNMYKNVSPFAVTVLSKQRWVNTLWLVQSLRMKSGCATVQLGTVFPQDWAIAVIHSVMTGFLLLH